MIGSRMKELREIVGLRQREVGLELDLHRNTIHNWESSDNDIPGLYEDLFNKLIKDPEKISWIKKARKERKIEYRENLLKGSLPKLKGDLE